MTATFVARHCKPLLVFPFLGLLSGCSIYSLQAMTVRDALMADQIDLAYSLVEEQGGYSDVVLKNMNKGILQRMKNDFVGSNRSLEKAKQRIDKLYGISVTEQLGSVIINDTVISYKGTRIEQLLLHAYMAMNYIEIGDLDAARVEMLQADVKMREWGDQPDDDPFIKYLTGIIYEALEEDDQAIVAYRHAMQAYKANRDRQDLDIPKLLVSDLIRVLEQEGLTDDAQALQSEFSKSFIKAVQTESDQGELVVVLSNGLAPIKLEHSITTYADEIAQTVRIALPIYAIEPDRLKTARIVIDDDSGLLETVENVDGLARSTLEEEMPLILTRAIARAIIKYKIQNKVINDKSKYGKSEYGKSRYGKSRDDRSRYGKTRQGKSRDNKSNDGFLITMANLVTERADTRSWSTLPQEIQMSRHWLPSGEHRIVIELVNNAGFVVDRIRENILIRPGKVTFIFKHWVSPRNKPEQKEPLSVSEDKPAFIAHAESNNREVIHV